MAVCFCAPEECHGEAVIEVARSSSPINTIQEVMIERLPDVVHRFQQEEGEWITPHCQHLQAGFVHFYGIHKNKQIQVDASGTPDVQATRDLYQQLKCHMLQNMHLPSDTEVVLVTGDSSAFSLEGTRTGSVFIKSHVPADVVVIYGLTGNVTADGRRCVNGIVSDLIEERECHEHVMANVVDFHTPMAIKEWGCSAPDQLLHYVIVYGDREQGARFGDDITSSDFIGDRQIVLDGGPQSFRELCNALLLDRKVDILAGLRTREKTWGMQGEVSTLYFSAAKFIQDLKLFVNEKGDAPSKGELQGWYDTYFGPGSCCSPNAAQKKLIDEGWNLIMEHALYLKINALVTLTQAEI